MTDEEAPDEMPDEPNGTVYPDGPIGDLMRQRDQARDAAENARTVCATWTRVATEQDARADTLQTAIDALGGEPQA